MARNTVPLKQIINDFIITIGDDDYAGGASDTQIRTHALRGIREMGFDMTKKIRSLKLTVDTSTNTVELPDDYVDWSKVGVVGSDGIVYVLGENKNINFSQAYANTSGEKVGKAADAYDTDSDGVYDRIDSKSVTNSGSPGNSDDICLTHMCSETTLTGLLRLSTALVEATTTVSSESTWTRTE
jgi:hypothetical protein